ncbi:MAG: hypothetical protein ACR2NV_00420 [Thermoleophilaceae bacterium]
MGTLMRTREAHLVASTPSRLALLTALLAALALALAVPPRAGAQDGDAPAEEPAPEAEATAKRGFPWIVLSHYASNHLPRLVAALNGSGMPEGTPVYFGTYYGSGKPSHRRQRARKVEAAVPSGRFAPIFPIQPSWFWERRRVLPGEEFKLKQAGVGVRRGRLPRMKRLLRLSSGARVRWGEELGRRFRDRIRSKERNGVDIATWQFDEILSQAAGPAGRRHRDLAKGVLRGLTFGRPVLGDKEQAGIVWMAHRALPLASRRARGDLPDFWATLDRASLVFVGEEYPDFTGSASRAARRQSLGHRALRRAGGPRGSLASKYVVGMSPGYRLGVSLGGNVRHRRRGGVNAFRDNYIAARLRQGVAGFGEFNFRSSNSRRRVMDDVMKALARGARAHPGTPRGEPEEG